ncbi:hypothetical protein EAO27_02455 [Sphingopyxis sp. YF1]|uniref:hypothetical protein n=1 Tax=Sphingopyxis sp. YF1 TaxID=2482763 RepID=UPI001F60F8B8|nr:hypothetical protein [Sphingopyxis sp. YF1]UNU41699.1 hypothetical protein EAO27_02455 [Sphingopyxis sp. YF1]
MKKLILPVLGLLATVPAAHAGETERRFEHEGRVYSYTVGTVGEHRVIRGVEEQTGKPFTLRVGTYKVRGTVGSQQVEFSLKDVKPLKASVTVLAAR